MRFAENARGGTRASSDARASAALTSRFGCDKTVRPTRETAT
jgi:hypothetical protein